MTRRCQRCGCHLSRYAHTNATLCAPCDNTIPVSHTVSPSKQTAYGHRGEHAYILRKAGHSWLSIATTLGYHTLRPADRAQNCARYHAARHGLPWPIPGRRGAHD